ncbi:MAG: sugar ABC transporter permease [Chloroflexi bacterium]|nr:sugar ABC transporter permease [Chloroflexota bacterium]
MDVATPRVAARRRRGLREHQREAVAGYLFILPAVLGILLFTAGPMLASLYLSFTKYDLVHVKWVGLFNYQFMASDPLFWRSLRVTVTYTIFAVPLGLVAGLTVAMLLNQKIKALSLYRTIFYLPALIGGVAISLLWMWIFNPQFGALNWLLSLIGIKGPQWIFSPTWVIPSFVLMSLWGVGGGMIIYLAGLQGIPTDLYDAASIDGAGAVRSFRSVTLPMLTPVLFFNLVIGIIGSFQIFTQAYVMTAGGPENASLFYVLYLYQNAFQYFYMGYASALAWVLFLIVIVLTAIVFRSSPMWVFYEGELRGKKG